MNGLEKRMSRNTRKSTALSTTRITHRNSCTNTFKESHVLSSPCTEANSSFVRLCQSTFAPMCLHAYFVRVNAPLLFFFKKSIRLINACLCTNMVPSALSTRNSGHFPSRATSNNPSFAIYLSKWGLLKFVGVQYGPTSDLVYSMNSMIEKSPPCF